MDEEENYNNNNDKGAMETIKNTAKKETKKLVKKGVKKVIKWALPYIGMFVLCLLAIGLIMATIGSILNFFAGLLGVDADSLSDSENATLTQAQKIISITENGYEINDEYSEKILEDLKSQKVDIDEMKFLDIDSDMIDKYIRAELKTMYPKIGVGTEIDGLVNIQRMSAETGVATTLTYIYYDDFISKVEANDVSVLNNFSLNPDTFELCIANAETVILYDYDNGSRKEVSRTTTITAKEIEYQTTIQRYATPLNYFISMHMICEDKSFMNDLVKMVDQKTDIVLTFLESTYKEFLQVDYDGEITTYYYENKPIISQTPNPDYPQDPHAPAYIEEVIGYSHSLTGTETKTVDTGNISEYSQYITPKQYVTEHVYNAGELYVTKANTWRLQSLLNVQVNEMHRDDIQIDNITNHVDIDEYDTVVFDREYSGSYNRGYIDEITNEWVESYSISINETAGGYDLTDFMALIESYPRVKNNLETAPSLLFYLLEDHENTQELAAVMKYVLFKFTGNNYGVTELDEIFDFQNFVSFGGIYGSNLEEKIWYALREAGLSEYAAAGVMGNLYAESGIRTNNLEDSKEQSLGHTDTSYTEAVNNGQYTSFISDRAGYGLAQWTFYTRKQGLYNFAQSINVSIDDENMQIEYLLGEIAHGGGANGYASCQITSYKGFTESDWKNASSPEDAAEAFCWLFEKPSSSVSHLNLRKEKARGYWQKYQGKTRPEGGDIQAATGDGFSQIYTSSTGRTYREYKQWMGSHARMIFTYYGQTIASSGCSITSVATVTSGYRNNQTPGSLASRTPVLAQLLTEGGAQCTGYQQANAQKLTSGKPAVVSISGNLITERGAKYYGGHYIAILDARNGNEVYVSDVGANDAKVRRLD